ncbi:MAG: class I SAM-dependent methyltransferase, partial [Deltaproteobacteria bacterium]|nr:class I SAM-dependent methyltransferase [Nannocystaceae bacterium]
MYHLPAYVAIERWAPGRVIVVVAPRTADGPRRLRDAGARVIVVGSLRTERGIEVRAGTPELPLPDGSVHMVACIEGYADLSPQQRARMLVEAKRILQPDGVMVAWTEHDDAPGKVDFWTLERELGAAFARVQMIAQIPWRGFSLAPVLDEGAAAPAVVVRESLLALPPAPTHYLALAGDEAARDRLGAALQCVLVPMAVEAEVVELA